MIKKSILLSVLVFFFTFSFSQKSNLVFFTEQGEPFYVILNGVKQNADARTNVKITDLAAPSYKCKIIFKNTELGQLDKTVYMKQGFEFTYIIKKNNKDKWLIRWMNELPIANTVISNADNTYQLSTSEPQSEDNATGNTSTKTTINIIDNQTTPNNENFDVSISDPNTSANISMNVNANANKATTQTTTTQTEVKHNYNKNTYKPNNQRQVTNAVAGYNGPYGCNHPMTAESFADVKTSISSKTFENSKLTVAKQVISNNCLTTSQVKEIMKLFDFEANRLDVAKFAYGYTYDKGNYYQLNDAFDFESSIDELNNYIKSKK